MATLTPPLHREEQSSLAAALIITRREIRDSLRDWRILTPIFILTLIFPVLMNFTAQVATDWVAQYDAEIVGERLIPFLLLIVGFFPISFSLVIALETFVGEKERNSIEPILSMPLTDLELYIGKMLAALFLPLLASYVGIGVYLMGLFFSIAWVPDLSLFTQILLLTTMKGMVMVSGAVVISSQTTSVRASNLLASFIIIPMALLLQAESILLFWGDYTVIWFIILALAIVVAILVRMGVRTFNREEILSREMDTLSLKGLWLDFSGYFLRSPLEALDRNKRPRFSWVNIFRRDLPLLLKQHLVPILLVSTVILAAGIGGSFAAPVFPLPAEQLDLSAIPEDAFEDIEATGVLPELSPGWVFMHNMRVILLSGVLGMFSFGALALIILMIPAVLVGYFAGAVGLAGYHPFIFLSTFILPHGIVEIPAAVIGVAFALRIGAGLISPPEGLDIGQGLLYTVANFLKVYLFLVMPLLFVAAILESYLTPWLVIAVYAGG